MRLKNNSSWVIILITLTLVGAFLRFYRLETLSTYLTDQALELLDTLAIIRGDIKLIGIKTSISEVRNGAVMNYLLIPFVYMFNYSPVAGGVLQSLLSLATVPLVFLIGKRAKNELSGVISAAVIALSPLLVEYSRQTQLAYYPLFFSSVVIFLLIKLTQKFENKFVILLGTLLGFVIQVHYLSFTLLILSLISIFVFMNRKNSFLLLAFGFLVGFAPLILFELSHDFFNTKMFFNYLSSSSPEAGRLTTFNYFPQLFSRLIGANNIIIGWFVLIGMVFLLFARIRTNLSKAEKVFVVHILISIAVMAVFEGSLWYHYLLPTFVSIIVLGSTSIAWLVSRYKNLAVPLLIMGLSLIVINFPSYRLSADNGAYMSPGWNLKGVVKTANIISQDVGGSSFNVAMLVDAQNQGYPLRYLLEVKNQKPLGISDYDKADNLYILVEPKLDLSSAFSNIYELNSFGGREVKSEWDIQNGYKLVKISKSN
ncbi:glycosyltransferase family 39 protein [Candidatus Gottesmanbacteria bacterium]|nr:glycosyltransferase family 39 protein [Candidatus Gottesmanbacteria bacterium]